MYSPRKPFRHEPARTVPTPRWILCLAAALAPALALPAGEPKPLPGERIAGLYAQVAPAVVGLTCRRERELYFGTGTIIDPDGLVITSTTVVPESPTELQVYLKGGIVHPAKLLLTDEKTELALLRIEREGDVRSFPYVPLGSSGRLSLGELALTFGNSFQSIQADDQVSLGKGVISGFYELDETYSQSKYSGPAIETSAPLNSGTDGGPLIDRDGRLIGVLSLNYSRSRWLGTAVPIDSLKSFIRKHLALLDEGADPLPPYLGLTLEGRGAGTVLVRQVAPEGPAAQAGVADGDRVVELDGEPVDGVPAVRERLEALPPGATIRLKLERDGKTHGVAVLSWGRF